MLDTFDRYVFESIVEKVIVGGYNEDGNKDPSMLTFIYKTGFKNSVDGSNFKPPRKNSKAAKQRAGLCSHATDEAKATCSYHSNNTCGDRRAAAKSGPLTVSPPPLHRGTEAHTAHRKRAPWDHAGLQGARVFLFSPFPSQGKPAVNSSRDFGRRTGYSP